MKKTKAAKNIKGRIKQINYVLRYWRKIFRQIPDFTMARMRRTHIKERLLEERNQLIGLLKASKKTATYETL